MKKVIITGVSGQDGSYMVDFLLRETSYLLYGVVRRSSNPDYSNLADALKSERFKLVTADLSDSQSIENVVMEINPDYFINFAAQSFVGASWQIPEQTFDVTAVGVLRCLEAIRKFAPSCRFYSAGSSEEMGNVQYCPQDLNHPIRPRSPYGAAKAAARHITKVYRESYSLYAIHSILYNHESERRGEEFVTMKIAKGAARIRKSISQGEEFIPIELGNLDSKRDWSHAKDFIKGIWMLLNQEEHNSNLKKEYQDALFQLVCDGSKEKHQQWETKWLSSRTKEYILSSGETHSIREFVEKAFLIAGIEGIWQGTGEEEEFKLKEITPTWTTKPFFLENQPNRSNYLRRCLVKINPKFYRPAEVEILLGDSSEARNELGWKPEVSFDELVEGMVRAEIDSLLY